MKPTKQQLPLITTLRSRRFLILSVVSWVIMLVLALIIVVPRIQGTLEIRSKNDELQKNVQSLQDKARFLESFKNAAFSSQNDKMQRILPSSKPFLQMLSTLEQLASQESVLFAGLEISPGLISTESATPTGKATDAIVHMDLKLKIIGTSTQINSFLDKLNTVTPAVDVNSYSTAIQRNAPGGSTPADQQYEADVNLALLYAPVSAGAAGQALPTLSAEENTYAKTKLSDYVIFSQDNLTIPSPDQLGKDDPFAL